MKNKKSIWIIGLLVALLVVGVVGATSAYAQGSLTGIFHGRGPGGGRGLGPTELAAAAKALGMTTDDLSAALKDGQTLQQIATSKGVDIQKVKDAISTARRDTLRTEINQAVTAGKLSQDKATWLLEGVDKGFLDGPGFGFGFGLGGQHGNGFGNNPLAQPTLSNP